MTLPLPQRGQPLDAVYIYNLVQKINEINNKLVTSGVNRSKIDVVGSASQDTKTSDLKFIGGYKEVAINRVVSASESISFDYSYTGSFRYPPIVTATPINISGTTAGQNVNVILTSVTAGQLSGIVRFNTAGEVSVGVNLIIAGIPYTTTN